MKLAVTVVSLSILVGLCGIVHYYSLISKLDRLMCRNLFLTTASWLILEKNIALCWIPSHVVIRGNERADAGHHAAAKSALSSKISAAKCPPTDLYQDLTKHYQTLACGVQWEDQSYYSLAI